MVVNGAGAGGHRLSRSDVCDGTDAQQCRALRHEGRHLSRPHRRHEPMEGGLCVGDASARTSRGRAGGRGCVHRPLGEGGGDAGHGEAHGGKADHLRHGQSRSRDHAGRSRARCAPTRSSPRAARTTPTRSTTCSAFPTSSAARSTSRARTINEEMKIAAAQCAGGTRARGRARRSGGGLSRRAPELRAGLHHSGAVRPSTDLARVSRGCRGRDEERRSAPSDQGSRGLWLPAVR